MERVLDDDVHLHFHTDLRLVKMGSLVCDLQGVKKEVDGNTQYLTDPVVHSRRGNFGRRDRGKKGQSDFFKTHKCNAVCELLGIKSK